MRRLIALGMCFVLMSGCSFALVSGPPANHQQLPAFECTTSRVGPLLDTIWTVLQTGNLILALVKDDQGWDDTFGGDPPFARSTGIGVYSVFAALGAAGMWFGFTRTGSCRDAKSQLAIRQSQQPTGPTGPQTWPPPQPGTNAPPAPPAPGTSTAPPAPPAPGAGTAPPAPPAPGTTAPPPPPPPAPPAPGTTPPNKPMLPKLPPSPPPKS